MEEPKKNIIFFDGVCGVCNFFVDFIIQRDPDCIFSFSPLQGETAQALLPQQKVHDMNSLVYYCDGQFFERSTAALKILNQLGPFWSLFSQFSFFVPLIARDWIYDRVAKHRYSLFGKKESCRIPTSKERKRFLP